MTSTYVTESFYKNVASTKTKIKEPTSDFQSFYQSMNEATYEQDVNTKDDYKQIKKKEKNYFEESNVNTSETTKTAEQPTDQAVEQTKEKPIVEKVEQDLEQKSKDMQKKIEEALGVTSEEVTKAMEALGMNAMDILNPEKLTQLMLELSGESDLLSLLTNEGMYGKVSDLVKQLETLMGEMQEEFSITPEELKEIMNKQVKPELNPEEVDETQIKHTASQKAQSQTDGKRPTVEIQVDSSREQETVTQEITDENPMAKEIKKQSPSIKNQQDNSSVQANTTKEPTEKVEEAPKNIELQLKSLKEQQGNLQDQPDSGKPHQEVAKEQVVMVDNGSNILQSVGDQIQAKLDAILQDSSKLAEQPNTEQIMKQVLNHMKLNVNSQVSEMELQLHPASLGTINLQVAFKNGALTAQLTAQNESVKVALESQMTQLKETLNEQGLKVETIEVTVESHAFERNLQQDHQGNNEGQQAKKQGRRRIVLDDLDPLEGQLNEEEQMLADIMIDNGNSVDFSA